MLHETIRKALEPFGATYSARPTTPTTTLVHIPGADREWMFDNQGDVWSRRAGSDDPDDSPMHWSYDHDANLTHGNQQTISGSPHAEGLLPNLINTLVQGQRRHTTPTHRVTIRQSAVLGPRREGGSGHFGERIQKLLQSNFAVYRKGEPTEVHRLDSDPDATALSAHPMPDHVQHGVNAVLQNQMPMEALIDHLIEHHGIDLPEKYARDYGAALDPR